MKQVTIPLTDAEFKGIKAYLTPDYPKVTYDEIRAYLGMLIRITLNNPDEAVHGLIQKHLPQVVPTPAPLDETAMNEISKMLTPNAEPTGQTPAPGEDTPAAETPVEETPAPVEMQVAAEPVEEIPAAVEEVTDVEQIPAAETEPAAKPQDPAKPFLFIPGGKVSAAVLIGLAHKEAEKHGLDWKAIQKQAKGQKREQMVETLGHYFEFC